MSTCSTIKGYKREAMSSQHRLNDPPSSDIDHANLLFENIAALYLSDEYSDVTLIVAGQRFDAHKIILAARSHYFRALLFGGLKESTQREIELKDASLPAFKRLLKYIYTGLVSLAECKEEVVLEILSLAHLYGFSELESSISLYLKEILSIKNVCLILDAALLYQLDYLSKVCHDYMDTHVLEVIRHESFLQLSHAAMSELIASDTFHASEIDIFLAVQDWLKANPDQGGESILSKVRFRLISISDLLNIVRPTGLVSSEAILDAIAAKTQTKDSTLGYRGLLLVNENVAKPSHGAQVLQGEMRGFLLDGNALDYDMERGYSRHTISKSQKNGLLIKLGNRYILNCIQMLLWDKDMRSYSYYVEVSTDQKDWVRIINHTKYFCRSWQYLYFEPRVVLYIRIIGTKNTVNKVFHVVTLEAYYTNEMERLQDGFVVPTRNVATLDRSAVVRDGVCRSRHDLLNGDTTNYDWASGYTCHQLGSGSILVQLGQPYVIDSMRLLLWDLDNRSYSYYIEVSGNSRDWDVVADKTGEACRSWQVIKFSPARPVVFIRITGVHNTANEVFHCVHFECPAQIEEKQSNSTKPVSPTPLEAETAAMSLDDQKETESSEENNEGS